MSNNYQGNYQTQIPAGASAPSRGIAGLFPWVLIIISGFLLTDEFLNTWNGRFSSLLAYPWALVVGLACLVSAAWLLRNTRSVPTTTKIEGLALYAFWAISTVTSLGVVYLLLKINYDYDLQIMARMRQMCNQINDLPGRELCTGFVGMSFYLIVTPVVMFIGGWVAYLTKKIVEQQVWFNVWIRGRLVPFLSILAFFASAHFYFLAEPTGFKDPLFTTPLYLSLGVLWLTYVCTRQPVLFKVALSTGVVVLIGFIYWTTR